MIKELQELASQGLITLRPNHDSSLFIANYTPKVQYDRLWTNTLKKCRGLIVDTEGTIMASPFSKFFNLEEHSPEEIPQEPFDVYEKMDGSLGILYWDGIHKIATRGSFDSDQAKKATALLHSKYEEYLGFFHHTFTYLFEIIYPENRIVCDYGDQERLVLLAAIDTITGEEIDPSLCGFPDIVKKYDGINDLARIRDFEDSEKEGFVIKYRSGFRVKVKFSEYVRLHKIITQVSAKSIWEYLKEAKELDELLDKVPDEFYDWVKKTQSELINQFFEIRGKAWEDFVARPRVESRKDFAMYATRCKYPNLLFSILDDKDITPVIWKMIKPEYERPFKTEI